MGRFVIAAVVGGLIVFIWTSVSHLALPTGGQGLENLPNEDAILSTLRANIPKKGLYFFPGLADMSDSAQKAHQAKIASGPTGIMMFNPGGGQMLSPQQLGTEFFSDLVAAFIIAWLLTMIAPTPGRGAVIAGVLGVWAVLVTTVSLMVWFDFPFAFVLTELVDQAIGWLVAGFVMVKILKPRAAGITSDEAWQRVVKRFST